MKRRTGDRRDAVRAILARTHAHVEVVDETSRGARASAPSHAVGADLAVLLRHARHWMKRHGKAHRHLLDAGRRATGDDNDAELVQVRYNPRKLAHPPHPPKVVVVSHARGKVIGEQG